MAKFDRPAAGYSPSLHTTNTTKYQDDSLVKTRISSLKIDGDINFVLDAVNEIWLLTGGGAGQTVISDTLTDFESRISTNTSAIASLVAGTIPDGDKGDITVSSGATVWTIDNGVVNTSKLADDAVTTDKLDASGKATVDLFLYRNFK